MKGSEVVEVIEAWLEKSKMKKTEFYDKIGISGATFSNWRRNVNFPSQENMKRIQEVTGLTFNIVDPDSNYELREELLSSEIRTLLRAAEGAPASAILEAAAQLMRYKEQSK